MVKADLFGDARKKVGSVRHVSVLYLASLPFHSRRAPRLVDRARPPQDHTSTPLPFRDDARLPAISFIKIIQLTLAFHQSCH
jgi:hypothetical protein